MLHETRIDRHDVSRKFFPVELRFTDADLARRPLSEEIVPVAGAAFEDVLLVCGSNAFAARKVELFKLHQEGVQFLFRERVAGLDPAPGIGLREAEDVKVSLDCVGHQPGDASRNDSFRQEVNNPPGCDFRSFAQHDVDRLLGQAPGDVVICDRPVG